MVYGSGHIGCRVRNHFVYIIRLPYFANGSVSRLFASFAKSFFRVQILERFSSVYRVSITLAVYERNQENLSSIRLGVGRLLALVLLQFKMDIEYKLVKEIDCKQGAVRAVRFSVDGTYCLTCGSDRKLKLWNPVRGVSLKTYAGHGDEVMDGSASCDSSQIVSCGLDKSVILWDVSTGTPVRRLRGHVGPVTTVRFNEESSMVVSGSRDNSAMLWDTRSKALEPVQYLSEAKDSISSVRVSDHEILTASFDGKIRRYDIRVGEMYADYTGDAVTCASFTRDGQCIVVSCADGVVRLMDKDSGELLGEFTGHAASNLCLESSVDTHDTRILSGSADGKLWIWDLVSQKVVAKLSGFKPTKHPIVSLSVHPQTNCFLATNGPSVLMWSSKSAQE